MRNDLRKVLDNHFRTIHYSDDTNVDEVVKLINKAVKNCSPKMLYKYRSCSKRSVREFRKDRLSAVSPSLFNDPYDCLLRYERPEDNGPMKKTQFEQLVDYYNRTGYLPEDFEKYLPLAWVDELKKNIKQYNAGEWTFQENDESSNFDEKFFFEKNALIPCSNFLCDFSRVSCFSERNDSILMWSHYADEHKGFVLGYDFRTDFNKEVLDSLYPVIYSKKRYDATDAIRYLVGELVKMRNNINQDQLFILAAALYKSKDWSYEKEWRIISYGNKEDFVRINLHPSCICYGSRIDSKDFDELHEIAMDKGIKEYNSYVDRTSSCYKMRLKRI